jgi:hypothetical protein
MFHLAKLNRNLQKNDGCTREFCLEGKRGLRRQDVTTARAVLCWVAMEVVKKVFERAKKCALQRFFRLLCSKINKRCFLDSLSFFLF